jgi:hypothetical protein
MGTKIGEMRRVKIDKIEFIERPSCPNTLVDSIFQLGIVNPPWVIETENGYKVVDGRYRLTAAKFAGLEEVPVFILEKVPMFTSIIGQVEPSLADKVSKFLTSLIEEHGKSGESLYLYGQLVAGVQVVNETLLAPGTLVVHDNIIIGKVESVGGLIKVNGKHYPAKELSPRRTKMAKVVQIHKDHCYVEGCALRVNCYNNIIKACDAMINDKELELYQDWSGSWHVL